MPVFVLQQKGREQQNCLTLLLFFIDLLLYIPVNSNGHALTLSSFYKTSTQHWDVMTTFEITTKGTPKACMYGWFDSTTLPGQLHTF